MRSTTHINTQSIDFPRLWRLDSKNIRHDSGAMIFIPLKTNLKEFISKSDSL